MTLNKTMQQSSSNAAGFQTDEGIKIKQDEKESYSIEKYVGKKIRLFRQLKELSQSDIAVHLGITFQQFQKYESGKNRIPISRLMKLATIFGVNMTVFFEDSVNVMFKDTMGKNTNRLNEDFIPIGSSIPVSFSTTSLDNDDEVELLKNFKTIKEVNVKKHVLMLVKSLSEGGKV